jgi:hypothetical protein
MACHWAWMTNPDGSRWWVHFNIRTPRRRKCAHCGCPDAKALCDWKIGGGKTCDKPCCFKCRRHVDTNVDYCMDHWDAIGWPPEPVQARLIE